MNPNYKANLDNEDELGKMEEEFEEYESLKKTQEGSWDKWRHTKPNRSTASPNDPGEFAVTGSDDGEWVDDDEWE